MSKKVLQLHPNKHKFYFSNAQPTPTTLMSVQILQCLFQLISSSMTELEKQPRADLHRGVQSTLAREGCLHEWVTEDYGTHIHLVIVIV